MDILKWKTSGSPKSETWGCKDVALSNTTDKSNQVPSKKESGPKRKDPNQMGKNVFNHRAVQS